ncbi:acyltransferase-domain-containing protein [Neohortaea acidophila]|uniref:Acyltransferase-domain-containing protein n=1 Tax=Neohortaea acidophila TaxID=245834 RepID=A0A6A6Q5V8_9PEZI|nr:acyltransferase-domain-containing protein [Neohortaea acidophila]KAF2487451.1 acyltransferase-domain-containing protein [Neohortaea acidophila]
MVTKATSAKTSSAPTKATSFVASSKTTSVRAGLSLTKPGSGNTNPIQHGKMGQAERAFSAASTFLSGIMAISASQFIGAPLKLVDPKFYAAYMAWTKESFAILVTTITQFWSPTLIRVSGDESMQGQLYQMPDGSLKCNFPHRLVLMANHQLYTDWLYLWWIAYTNKMHGHIYIILKESLKSLPILGWGAQFYNFIFLSRKWETDKARFKSALNRLKSARRPMWLLIFPEGTNLSAVTRETSAAWAKKSGLQDMKHQLLPRTTGLQFCLQELRGTTNWLYDCTIAYEGIPNGMYGQDIFTLRSSFFEGRPPKSVNMFWRRFKLADVPLDNDEAFARWLNNRWREKDYILEYFYKYNQFPDEAPQQALAAARGQKKPKHAKAICTEVKGEGWQEFLSIFGPLTTAAGALLRSSRL